MAIERKKGSGLFEFFFVFKIIFKIYFFLTLQIKILALAFTKISSPPVLGGAGGGPPPIYEARKQ